MVHPLLREQEDPDEKRARQEAEYEEKLVGHLMAHYKLSSYKSYLRKEIARRFGTSRLMLSEFLNQFNNFPVYMAVAKIPGLIKTCTVDMLYNKFSTRKMVERYTELRDEIVPEEYVDLPFALAFPWPYIAKGMVLHDKHVAIDEILPGLDKPCVRMIWTLSKRKQRYGQYLVMEPMDQFLAGLNWEPKSPYPED
jgi:hypothetical protein